MYRRKQNNQFVPSELRWPWRIIHNAREIPGDNSCYFDPETGQIICDATETGPASQDPPPEPDGPPPPDWPPGEPWPPEPPSPPEPEPPSPEETLLKLISGVGKP